MCAWRIPSISPTRSPPPTVTRKSLCKLKNCFRVQTIKSLPSPFCVLTLVSEMTRKGWELSSSCRRRGARKVESSCWDGCSPGDRRKPTGSCSHGRVLLAPAICLPACPASQPTDQIIQYGPIHLRLGSKITRVVALAIAGKPTICPPLSVTLSKYFQNCPLFHLKY